MNTKLKKIPIGYDDYKQLIETDFYYVDKTLLIKDLLDNRAQVQVFTRPRRFGKTLNLSMLRYFFEKPVNGSSNMHLFEDKLIMGQGEEYTCHQEQYPVIFMSLKSGKQGNFQMAYEMLCREISKEFSRHSYVMGGLEEKDREKYHNFLMENFDNSEWYTAVAFLSRCLEQYHQKKVIILIDEYDVPLENAYYSGFYDEMVRFIRSLFESALKTNSSLELAVITGCLRISKESIFTGLNNLEIVSILNSVYKEHFGFTQSDVDKMLEYYNLTERKEIIRKWYDGYIFGKTEVYNPWSVINFVKSLRANLDAFPVEYWSNTSSNTIVKDLIYRADKETRQEVEHLIAGGTIRKPVHEEITYDDIHKTQDNLWNFLFFTGYLKMIAMEQVENQRYVTMEIPNIEVQNIYKNQVSDWFREEIKKKNLSPFYSAVAKGDGERLQKELALILKDSISYMETYESFYHGMLLGLLIGQDDYKVTSNREAGNGRYDLCMTDWSGIEVPVILEFKVCDSRKGLEEAALTALAQIKEMHYDAPLEDDGYEESIHIGIGFYRKMCCVRVERVELEVE